MRHMTPLNILLVCITVLVSRALRKEFRVLCVVKRREAYGQLLPIIIRFLFRTVCDHEVLDMETGALDAFIEHH